jgi:hypothetical protein
MLKIIGQLKDYFTSVDKMVFFTGALFTAAMIWANYSFDINGRITKLPFMGEVGSWYLLFVSSFSLAHLLPALRNQENYTRDRGFLLMLLVAPLPFALKMGATIDIDFSISPGANDYWNTIAYWPIKLMGLLFLLFIMWMLSGRPPGFYGMKAPAFSLRPYVIMLLLMIPLIAAAATQPDFLKVYPKLQHLSHYPDAAHRALYGALFEMSYGSDFIGIELFFRGFLVLAFARWAGKDAILPMAVFYCTIHFGKPLGECISSFFGGILLGVVTYHSRSIWGGLFVHLGIAWLMELGGYLGNLYLN